MSYVMVDIAVPGLYSMVSFFDWSFINYYFHRFTGGNPFGYSSQNLDSLYTGVVKDAFASFEHRGNAEALLAIKRDFGLKIDLT